MKLQISQAKIPKHLLKYFKPIGIKAKSDCQIPSRFAIAMADAGWILRNEIIWYKRNCLNGSTKLYARTQKGTMPSTIKDLVRLKPSTVELWDGVKWNKVVEWIENKSPQNIKRITLRSGELIKCTGDHLFPVGDKNIKASNLQIGSIINSAKLPDNNDCPPEYLSNDIIGWFVGLYIAEGSKSGKCIQIASHTKETKRFERLKQLAHYYHGTCKMYNTHGNTATINIYSDVLNGVIDEYMAGKTSHDKRLTTKAWQRSNDFLSHVLEGYLSGDGHYDKGSDRWRLGFTRNNYLANDLRLICARLGYRIKLSPRTSMCNGKEFKTYHGELRYKKSTHFNWKSQYEIMEIEDGKNAGKFWDIVLELEPHLFSTISGTLIHNCMPSSAKDRFTVDFEKLFFFTKNKKYWFEQQKEPHLTQELRPDGIVRQREYGYDGKYSPDVSESLNSPRARMNRDGYDTSSFYGEGGRNKRTVWDIPTKPYGEAHFAVFPEELVETPIMAGCPEGGVVLDPFMGSGTVGLVALKLNRKFIGFELNPEYIKIAEKRIHPEIIKCKLAL